MCRSIKRLRTPEGAVTEEEIREAALQFVRKISGARTPPAAAPDAFAAAIDEVTAASRRLLAALPPVRASRGSETA